MRLEKTVAVLTLARALASHFDGLTLDEMAAVVNTSRRTAERMRDAVEAAFGPLEREDDGRKARFRLAARGLRNFASAPTAEELAELENAARALEAAGNKSRAASLRSLNAKIGASLREADRRRLGVDVEAQLRAETLARQVGPRPLADPAVLARLREALLQGLMVKFDYGRPPRWRKVVPYGLLFGPRAYLVARVKSRAAPALFRLDAIHGLEVLDEPGAPPPDFDLQAYAERSFGVFQEEPQEIVLSFAPAAAPDARAFLFHPTQSLSEEADGSLTVRLRAGGLLEIAHHLMNWGPSVTIVAPPALKDRMRELVAALHAHYC
jgi:predicted DNA-binding transcriptional regulator YafY